MERHFGRFVLRSEILDTRARAVPRLHILPSTNDFHDTYSLLDASTDFQTVGLASLVP